MSTRLSLHCLTPEADPSTQLVDINRTFAQYTCRAGYRIESGDLQRSCDANGTWSGSPPVCVVDSVMPKAYLVILIVGATVAVFLACIPYDFYRFRKRKKKVRDHQERLSLVTRIAPGHAKVIIETVAIEPELATNAHQRRFGLKSLFSVFRFVGGKMKAGQGAPDSSHPLCPEGHAEPLSGSDQGPESDGLTASSFVFPPDQSSAGPSAHDGLESCDEDMDLAEKRPGGLMDDTSGPRSPPQATSPSCLVPCAISPSTSTGAVSKKSFSMFHKANEMFGLQLTAMRQESDTRGALPSTSISNEPAVVQVTCLNDVSLVRNAFEEIPPSTSSPEIASLPASTNLTLERRSLPGNVTSITYHSMPSIQDNSP
ncbi:hypothetical protein BgiBS90_035295 [Biomphalaria glabrata]|nr:hypothetical protein BgiBS90_035295 [Biomphalaria glabrata]